MKEGVAFLAFYPIGYLFYLVAVDEQARFASDQLNICIMWRSVLDP